MATTTWRNRIVGSEQVPPTDLLANPNNWRTHPPKQRDALRGSLSEVGWVQQVIVNTVTGHMIDGHARAEEAISRGEPFVPVLYVELDPDEEKLVLATLDPIGALAARDDERLTELLADIHTDDAGLLALLDEMEAKAPKAGLTDPDDAPDLGEETHIKRGDLFALGDHRLMCGDATSAEEVGRLLDGAKPNLTITDPPYGVNYDASWRREVDPRWNYREGKVANDERADWAPAMALLPGAIAYVWHGGLHASVVEASLTAVGFEVRAQIIWAKPSLVMGRGAYHWQHEPAWYAIRKGASADWLGGRKQSTIWDIQPVHRTQGTSDDAITDHSTQKPVELLSRPILNHRGDVYDPFVGSGTTIIAAEQLGRRCYAMEIDPRYVAVAIKRWEDFTGRTSERIDA